MFRHDVEQAVAGTGNGLEWFCRSPSWHTDPNFISVIGNILLVSKGQAKVYKRGPHYGFLKRKFCSQFHETPADPLQYMFLVDSSYPTAENPNQHYPYYMANFPGTGRNSATGRRLPKHTVSVPEAQGGDVQVDLEWRGCTWKIPYAV